MIWTSRSRVALATAVSSPYQCRGARNAGSHRLCYQGRSRHCSRSWRRYSTRAVVRAVRDPRAVHGCVVIDLATELTAWLKSSDARTAMKQIVAEAVQSEIKSALEDELIDVERAAAMLDMTEGALRKAVERGQVPCQRIGTRLRFRRMELISLHPQARSSARATSR